MNRGGWLRARAKIPNNIGSMFSAGSSVGATGASVASQAATTGAAAVQSAGGLAAKDVLSGAVGQTGITGGSSFSSIPREITSAAKGAASSVQNIASNKFFSQNRIGQLYGEYKNSTDFADFVSRGVEKDLFTSDKNQQGQPIPQQVLPTRAYNPYGGGGDINKVVDILQRLGIG